MDSIEFLAELGASQSSAVVSPYWDRTLACPKMPDNSRYPSVKQIRYWREFCGFPADLDSILLHTAKVIKKNRKLRLLFIHLCRRLAIYPEASYEVFNAWPDMKTVLGADNGVFYLLAGLSIVPLVLKKHKSMGIPEEISRETLNQLYCFCENYRKDNDGRPGILRRQFFWLTHYIHGCLFRLGRFEYKLEKNPQCIRVFRQKESYQLQAFLPPGLPITKDGFIAADSEDAVISIKSADECILSEYLRTAAYVQANPVLPDGRMSSLAIKLPLKDWDQILGPDDYVLDVHIPAGGSMSMDAVEDSFRKAVSFFTNYVPAIIPKAFFCVSWIFNPALQSILPHSSNLVRLQQRVHLFPVPTNNKDGLFFIFGEEEDFTKMPRHTSLQKSIWHYIEAGNVWRGGGMYLLTDEL